MNDCTKYAHTATHPLLPHCTFLNIGSLPIAQRVYIQCPCIHPLYIVQHYLGRDKWMTVQSMHNAHTATHLLPLHCTFLNIGIFPMLGWSSARSPPSVRTEVEVVGVKNYHAQYSEEDEQVSGLSLVQSHTCSSVAPVSIIGGSNVGKGLNTVTIG